MAGNDDNDFWQGEAGGNDAASGAQSAAAASEMPWWMTIYDDYEYCTTMCGRYATEQHLASMHRPQSALGSRRQRHDPVWGARRGQTPHPSNV